MFSFHQYSFAQATLSNSQHNKCNIIYLKQTVNGNPNEIISKHPWRYFFAVQGGSTSAIFKCCISCMDSVIQLHMYQHHKDLKNRNDARGNIYFQNTIHKIAICKLHK